MKTTKIFIIFILSILLFSETCIRVYADESVVLISVSSDINAQKSKVGDVYKFKILDDIVDCKKVILPKNSLIEGRVVKIKKSSFVRSDAFVDIILTGIENDIIQTNFKNDDISIRISDYRYKTRKKKIIQRAPVYLTSYATSIALGATTEWTGGVIFALALASSLTSGFLSGYADPDSGKTRIQGAAVRGFEGTPAGTVLIMIQKGYDVNCGKNCILAITLDEKSKQKIASALKKSNIVK